MRLEEQVAAEAARASTEIGAAMEGTVERVRASLEAWLARWLPDELAFLDGLKANLSAAWQQSGSSDPQGLEILSRAIQRRHEMLTRMVGLDAGSARVAGALHPEMIERRPRLATVIDVEAG